MLRFWTFLVINFAATLYEIQGDLDSSKKNGHHARFRRSGHDDEDDDDHEEGPHHGDHGSVINSLFEGYDTTSSPTHDAGTPTVITVSIHLISLDGVSDENMEFTIDTRVTFAWDDHRLMTPECRDEEVKDCDDHFNMKSHMDKLWMPDMYFVNSRSATFHEQPVRNGMIYLIATGRVILSKRLTLTLLCPMDLELYPLDTQECPLLICPYSLTEKDMILQWDERGIGLLDEETEHNKFTLILPIKTGATKIFYDGPDVSGHFSCVNASFVLERQYGYHLAYSYTVTLFVVVVSWVSFWLEVTAVPARVTLGVTTLLTLITTANHVRSSLPPITYLTAIDVWVGVCSFFVFAALLEFPMSAHMAKENTHQSPKVFTLVEPGSVLRSRKLGDAQRRQSSWDSRKPEEQKKKKKKTDMDKICRICFPGTFLLFAIVYWSYYITKSKT